jgi:uncharacterized protein (TIGR00255 family)
MTGFGAGEGTVAGRGLRVEVRTVNHRFFNPAFKLPGDLGAFEGEFRERLRRDLDRGHVAVSARWESDARAGGTLRLNVARAQEAVALLRELRDAVGGSGEIPLDLVARQPEVLSLEDTSETGPEWAAIEPILAGAIAACLAMRRREGEALAAELAGRLGELGRLADGVERLAPARLHRELARLRANVAALLGGATADEQRIAQEIAVQADRLDVTEELVRLRAHLVAAGNALRKDGPVGKALGFLAQEIGREVNTIGSKANDAEIAHAVVAMKGELEKFREQVENLE